MEPVETAVVPWALVTLSFSPLQAVLAAELVVLVRLASAPVVRELSVRSRASLVVLVEVMAVEPKPVRPIEPEVPVRLRAPVVRVRPLEAVRSPAEVMVPELEVLMLPEVVTLSPVVVGDRVVPVRCQ